MTEKKRIGVAIAARGSVLPGDSNEALAQIQRAEELGVQAAWMTTGGAGPDALTIFAAAAVRTQSILLGTSITPTWPRHPVAVAQQAQVLAQLSGGRFRLGVGPSHKGGMTEMFGADFKAPLGHLEEYLRILKSLLQKGSVDVDGQYYKAHAQIAAPMDVPVMASALRRRSYELCGAEADGAISWVCPGEHLRDTALPALRSGAEGAGRTAPPLVAHAPVSVHENGAEVRQALREQFGNFPRTPFYVQMFKDAGFPEAAEGDWSDAMIDAVALYGGEEQVAEKLQRLLSYGATEIIASPVLSGRDPEASWERTVRLLAQAG